MVSFWSRVVLVQTKSYGLAIQDLFPDLPFDQPVELPACGRPLPLGAEELRQSDDLRLRNRNGRIDWRGTSEYTVQDKQQRAQPEEVNQGLA